MTVNATSLNQLNAAAAKVGAMPQARPSPLLAFGDVLAGLIQLGRPEEIVPSPRDGQMGETPKAARFQAEPGDSADPARREVPDVEDTGTLPGEGNLPAQGPREADIPYTEVLPEKAVRVAVRQEALPQENAGPGNVPLDFESAKMVGADKGEPRTPVTVEQVMPDERLASAELTPGTYARHGAPAAQNTGPLPAAEPELFHPAGTPQAVMNATPQTVVSEVAAEMRPVYNEAAARADVPLNVQAASIIATEAPQASLSGDTGAEARSGGSETFGRIEAPSADKSSGRVFEKLGLNRKEAGSAQRAMIERITKFTKSGGPKRVGHIRMTLTPAKLGTLQMDLRVKDGSLSVICRSDNEVARGVLLGGIEDLRAALSEEGMQLGEFNVSVDGQDGKAGTFADGRAGRNGAHTVADTPAQRTESAIAASGMPVLLDCTA